MQWRVAQCITTIFCVAQFVDKIGEASQFIFACALDRSQRFERDFGFINPTIRGGSFDR